jgi:uncharacterized membrane protein
MADTTEEVQEAVSPNGDNGSGLAGVAKNNVTPLLVTAAAATAAGLAATKGPDLMRKLSGQANSQAEQLGAKAAEGAKEQVLGGSGGAGGVLGTVGKAASKLLPGGGGGGQKGGKTRRLPIQRWTDVAVPVDKAYEAWTQWEEWPKFMHRVLEVKPAENDDDEVAEKIHYREKIWFWTREWDGEITEQRKNDRIAWKTVSGVQHSGVVSFHKLDDNLTRVMVDMDFLPSGIFEKMASGMRFVKRALQADLARFKAYVEFGDAEGIEYKSSPAEMEQNQDGDDDDSNGDDQAEQQEEQQAEGDADEQQAEGDADEQQSQADNDSSADEEERENERQERESRREERRKALTGS